MEFTKFIKENKYPDNWEQIAWNIKVKAGWRYERCRVKNSGTPNGDLLTVHHLVPDKSLCEEWNLCALCQRCHLRMKCVNMFQSLLTFYEFALWFKPHLEGFLEWIERRKK